MTSTRNAGNINSFDPRDCPSCGAQSVSSRIEDRHFPYGTGLAQVDLTARVAVHSCKSCAFEFLDDSAEDARHEAVCRHVGVMTPAEVISIRKTHGYSRADFARLTQLGEASLSRWENGVLIQNSANDQFLYLLWFPENVDRLRLRLKGRLPSALAEKDRRSISSAGAPFRALTPTPTHQRNENEFRLRLAS